MTALKVHAVSLTQNIAFLKQQFYSTGKYSYKYCILSYYYSSWKNNCPASIIILSMLKLVLAMWHYVFSHPLQLLHPLLPLVGSGCSQVEVVVVDQAEAKGQLVLAAS